MNEQVESWNICRSSTSRAYEDIGYFVATEVYDYRVEVVVYKILWKEEGPESGFVFNKKGSAFSPDPVTTLAEAERFLSGHIKWDGCSNLSFDEQEEARLHFCGKQEAVNVGVLLGRLYDLAAEISINWLARDRKG